MKEDYQKIEEAIRTEIKDKSLDILAIYFSSSTILKNFVEEINTLTGIGEGSSEQGILGCTFPRQLDEYEVVNHGFDGIAFSLFEDTVVVDIPTFRKYLRIACEVYWQEHPESKEILQKYLARPQPPLEEGALDEWKRRRDAGEYPKPYSEFE